MPILTHLGAFVGGVIAGVFGLLGLAALMATRQEQPSADPGPIETEPAISGGWPLPRREPSFSASLDQPAGGIFRRRDPGR